MKLLMNITSARCDLDRYASAQDLYRYTAGLGGVELMDIENDGRHILDGVDIVGYHAVFPDGWVDLWRGDMLSLEREFGSLDECEKRFGGLKRECLVGKLKAELDRARELGAEYAVFHAADCTVNETFDRRWRRTDSEVIDAVCELVNAAHTRDRPLLLLENMWTSGFNFADPSCTRRLLDGVKGLNVGIMLDTGHLMSTNTKLRDMEGAAAYINGLLDRHSELCAHIRGVHLSASLSGEYAERVMAKNRPPSGTYADRRSEMFSHIFRLDEHRPFTGTGVRGLVERIAPEYLTLEFITESREQHREYLDMQLAALGREVTPR